MGLLNPVDEDTPPDEPPFRVRAGWAVGVFLVTLLVYAIFTQRILYYTNPPTGDQPFYLHTAISIVQDGDINESNNYDQQDERQYYPRFTVANDGYYPADFPGIPAPWPLPPHDGKTTARPAGEEYSKHGLGLSVLIVPGWALGTHWTPPGIDLNALDQPGAGWPTVVYELNILGALLAVQVFLLAFEATRRWEIGLIIWAALAFSNPQMTYSYLIFPELPAGLCAIYAFRRLALGWQANGPLRLLAIGVAAGFLPWLHARFLPISGALVLFALWSWWRARHAGAAAVQPRLAPVPPFLTHALRNTATFQPASVPTPAPPSRTQAVGNTATYWTKPIRRASAGPRPAPRLRRPGVLGLLVALVPVALSLVALGLFYSWLYGTILPNTGDHAGFINPLTDPWGVPVALLGLLFDQQWGLLMAAPVYILAFVGLVAMRRAPDGRMLLRWLLFAVVPYLLLIAFYRQWWGEWCPPARYLAPITPLLALPLAQALLVLRRSVLYNALFGLFTAGGWAIMAGFLLHPHSLWNQPNGKSNLFVWLAAHSRLNLVPHLPAVVLWFFDHRFTIRWELLIAWAVFGAAIVLAGLLLLANTEREGPGIRYQASGATDEGAW